MKFGNNLQYLSIPEWKCYNLDYNELKYQIRSITQNHSHNTQTLPKLKQSFIDNFDYINLFIATKYGELLRKYNYYEVYFHQLLNNSIISSSPSANNEEVIRHVLIELDEIFYQIIEISIELKKLSKFILIQKIAIKKIFKKFLKYYTSKNNTKFILELKSYLTSNPKSLINFDLSSLTLKLTNFINLIKYERRRFNNLFTITTNTTTTSRSAMPMDRKLSLFSIASTLISDTHYQNSVIRPNHRRNNSTFGQASISSQRQQPQRSQSQNRPIPHIQQDPISLESHFDLSIYLKKNFQLHALIPQDSNTLNEIILNFNIYLNLKNISTSSTDYVSYIYLTHDNLSIEHSTIVSTSNSDSSIIIAHIGDLRKYGYCILPNNIVQLFISHLNDRSNEEIKQQLIDYFQQNECSHLTKKTIDYIVSHNLKPTLKLFCKRLRYIVDEEDSNDVNEVNENNNQECESVIDDDVEDEDDEDQRSIISSYTDNRYLIALDSEISTTNEKSYVNTVEFPENYDSFDLFPHNHLAIYSNDSTLSNFEKSLETLIDVKDGLVKNQYGTMKKLPKKVQTILNNNCVSLFKGLNFYQYQLSCYYNIIPNGEFINNHYTNLLNLNLFKNFENIESLNQQINEENDLITKKSYKIIQHKMSMKSLHSPMNTFDNQKTNSLGSSTNSIFEAVANSNENEEEDGGSISPDELVQFNNDDTIMEDGDNEEDDEEDDYAIYLKMDEHGSHDSSLNNFILTVLNFKNRLFKHVDKPKRRKLQNPTRKKKINENPVFISDEEQYLDPYTKLLSCYHSGNFNNNSGTGTPGGYDSINEEPPTFLQRNQYHLKYHQQYDQTLSYIYFSLDLISLFLSGIQFGIIYSIFATSSSTDSQFLIGNNVGLMIVLILGIALSLVFSMISINLMYYRYTDVPSAHSWLVWSGFVMVACCCIWSGVLILF
ncbi:uncharacterized protein J8A68_000726 [[Candida] subhashii]|uniref:SPX domain-containing protein n=1 Tax=[Candida] subhashii TaxID=561895 RepID=A0A8J5QJ78_9ASCO|nr:uncharacterized protein J8A68_000726 [[Candida] subhashii]KAG7665706.1 hypothetical protein J8A68_000726 [[Candida] subhashii]